MISSLTELNNLPVLLIMYEAGSSGEFFASALSQCFPDIAASDNYYCDSDRVLFNDLLGRSLLTGDACENDIPLLLSRANQYLSANTAPWYLAIAHPQQRYKDFVLSHFPNWFSITITHDTKRSQSFVQSALMKKLNMKWRARLDAANMHWRTVNNLELEWDDVVNGPAKETLDKVQTFTGLTGNLEKFEQLLTQYRSRNALLIDLLLKPHS